MNQFKKTLKLNRFGVPKSIAPFLMQCHTISHFPLGENKLRSGLSENNNIY